VPPALARNPGRQLRHAAHGPQTVSTRQQTTRPAMAGPAHSPSGPKPMKFSPPAPVAAGPRLPDATPAPRGR
jgi:hypothetical protein